MTARERMITAIAGGKPDRVPIALVGDKTFYAKAADLPLGWEYGDYYTRIIVQRQAYARFPENDFLGYLQLGGVVDPNAIIPRRVVVEDGRPYLEDVPTGERMPIERRAPAAGWAAGASRTTSESDWKQLIESAADITRALAALPELDPSDNPHGWLRGELGEEVYLAGDLEANVHTALAMMGGFESGMMALHEKPHVFQSLVERLALRSCARVQQMARADLDAVWLGAYLEGADLISPTVWREVALPGHRIHVQAAHAVGLQALMWFLGDCLPLLDDLVELGIDGLVVEQDRRGYSSDPVEIRRRIGNAFCVYGWNWELDFINDDRERITQEVERQIRGAGADGAFIMGATFLTSEADLGAIEHFCQEVVRVSQEVGY